MKSNRQTLTLVKKGLRDTSYVLVYNLVCLLCNDHKTFPILNHRLYTEPSPSQVQDKRNTTHLRSVFDILTKHKRYCYIWLLLLSSVSISVTARSIFLIFMFLKWEQERPSFNIMFVIVCIMPLLLLVSRQHWSEETNSTFHGQNPKSFGILIFISCFNILTFTVNI